MNDEPETKESSRSPTPPSRPADDHGSERTPATLRSEWLQLSFGIFGLAGLAIAQPLFTLLGDNPTYFVAHRTHPSDIVVFAAFMILLPAAAVMIPVLLIGLISPPARRIAGAIAIGGLASLVVLGGIEAADGWRIRFFAAALAIGAGLGAWCYLRFRAARLFATYLGPMPVVFAGLFLFSSGASPLVFGDDPEVLAADHTTAPVVVLVFDELPFGALLRPDGSIDSDRFPGFAELAEVSTWYPRATTVATYTYMAIPALLAGRLPDPEVPPVAGQYPRSLFTMLGGSHDVHASEQVTSLCPESICEAPRQSPERQSFSRDTAIVALHQLLPGSLANRWLPSISGSWTNFGEQLERAPLPDDGVELDLAQWEDQMWDGADPTGYLEFLASLSNAPGLWYQHEMIPHMGHRFLPDGRTYQGTSPRSWNFGSRWAEDPLATVNTQQRLLLQLQYADTHVTALLDRVREQGMLDDALLVVLADHGIDLGPGRNQRGHFPRGEEGPAVPEEAMRDVRDAVLPIPLFIKYPGQTTGVVDERDAQSIDVLPTIADALGLNLPDEWEFDGRSLLAEPAQSGIRRQWVTFSGVDDVPTHPDPVRVAQDIAELVGPHRATHDIYAVGPYRDLVGTEVTEPGPTVEGAHITSKEPDAYSDVDPDGPFVPVLFTGYVAGVNPGEWVALAVDGTIAGLGPVFVGRSDKIFVEILIDPALMRTGENRLDLYVVGADGQTLSPVAVS